MFTKEQAQMEEIAGYLDEIGYVVSEELIADGIAEYHAHGGRGDNQDIADFIEREFLTEEPEPELLDRAKELINNFCLAKYGDSADFSDLQQVGIAYTTTEYEDVSIQVNVNLLNCRIERYLDGQFLERRQYESLKELILNELEDLDFDTLTFVSESELNLLGFSTEDPELYADYRLLNRLKADCDYFLGAGGRAEKHLWAGNVREQIAKMRELYASLPEQPEWLSPEDIDRYEQQMTSGQEKQEPQPKKETVSLPKKHSHRERITFAALHPEIPREQRHDFHITNDMLGHGTPSEKYAANAAAIRTLKQIEAEERLATPEEQEVLSRYVGWGGLSDCFDERHSKYQELKSLLDEDEYAAARASS